MNRRPFLRSGGLCGVVAVAGCLGSGLGLGNGNNESVDAIELPALEVAGSPGGTVALRQPNRLSLIDFFATWCGPCKPQMGTLGATRERFSNEELHMVSVTNESDEQAIKQFWRQYDGQWPVTRDVDNEATQQYSVKGIPTLVLVGSDGTEHWRHRGLAGEDTLKNQVSAALED